MAKTEEPWRICLKRLGEIFSQGKTLKFHPISASSRALKNKCCAIISKPICTQTQATSNRTSCTTKSNSSSCSRTSSTCRGRCQAPQHPSSNSQFITSRPSRVATRSRQQDPLNKHPLLFSLILKVNSQPPKPRPLLTRLEVCHKPSMGRHSASSPSHSTSRWKPTDKVSPTLNCPDPTPRTPSLLERSISPVSKNRFKIQMLSRPVTWHTSTSSARSPSRTAALRAWS